jgi:methylmalonyl-CoA mutase C-terminal domain/subunit
MDRKTRVLIAKPGLDGHDKGALIVASLLRDAGFEVVYTGLRKKPKQIVNAAVQEDVDIIGLSMLSGSHLGLCREIMALLKEEGLQDKIVILGGVIPDEDMPELKQMGIDAVFTQSTNVETMIDYMKNRVARKK